MNTKQRMVIMTPLLAAAAWLAFFGDKTPSGGVAEPVARVPTRMVSKAIDSDIASTAAPAAMTETDTTEQAGAILRLASREPLKAELALTNPTDIFSVGGGPTPVVKPQENVPPPPPPPPEVTFSYVGKKYEDGKWTAFFEKNSQIFFAQEGTTIEGFRIDAIRPDDIQLTDWQTKGIHVIPTKSDR